MRGLSSDDHSHAARSRIPVLCFSALRTRSLDAVWRPTLRKLGAQISGHASLLHLRSGLFFTVTALPTTGLAGGAPCALGITDLDSFTQYTAPPRPRPDDHTQASTYGMTLHSHILQVMGSTTSSIQRCITSHNGSYPVVHIEGLPCVESDHKS